MATAQLKEPSGAAKGTVELPAEIFDAKIHRHAMWQAVVGYLQNQRQGTVKTKVRSEVRGGGLKPWRQKGTGRARSGSIRSSVWVGGARTKGPRPRNWAVSVPKKVRSLALRSAFSVRARDGQITVLTEAGVKEGRTRELANLIKAMGLGEQKCLIVLEGYDPIAVQAGRNMPRLNLTNAAEVNTYDVLWADHVLVTNAALTTLKETRA